MVLQRQVRGSPTEHRHSSRIAWVPRVNLRNMPLCITSCQMSLDVVGRIPQTLTHAGADQRLLGSARQIDRTHRLTGTMADLYNEQTPGGFPKSRAASPCHRLQRERHTEEQGLITKTFFISWGLSLLRVSIRHRHYANLSSFYVCFVEDAFSTNDNPGFCSTAGVLKCTNGIGICHRESVPLAGSLWAIRIRWTLLVEVSSSKSV